MKTITILAISLMLTGLSEAQFVMEKQVLSCAGEVIASPQYEMNGTLAQPATGASASAGYVLHAGFWAPELQAPSTCVFGDDFSDLDASDWIATGGTWSAQTGSLVATSDKKADSISNAFAGCGVGCSVQATLQAQSGAMASLLGWNVDAKTNVELIMAERKDKWLLKQKINGFKVAKAKFKTTIQPDTPYVARIIYSGSTLQVLVNGVTVINVPAGVGASGGIGARIKSVTKTQVSATFDDFCVIP